MCRKTNGCEGQLPTQTRLSTQYEVSGSFRAETDSARSSALGRAACGLGHCLAIDYLGASYSYIPS